MPACAALGRPVCGAGLGAMVLWSATCQGWLSMASCNWQAQVEPQFCHQDVPHDGGSLLAGRLGGTACLRCVVQAEMQLTVHLKQ